MRKLAGQLTILAMGSASADTGAVGRTVAQDAAVGFWTGAYTGAELATDNYHCAAPEVPAVSHANLQIRSVHKAIVQWEACHEGYMNRLRATPADARIPADVLAAMTPSERAQARTHVDAVVARVAEAAQANAAHMMARHETWLGATVEYVAQHNTGVRNSRRLAAWQGEFARRERQSERLELRERLRKER